VKSLSSTSLQQLQTQSQLQSQQLSQTSSESASLSPTTGLVLPRISSSSRILTPRSSTALQLPQSHSQSQLQPQSQPQPQPNPQPQPQPQLVSTPRQSPQKVITEEGSTVIPESRKAVLVQLCLQLSLKLNGLVDQINIYREKISQQDPQNLAVSYRSLKQIKQELLKFQENNLLAFTQSFPITTSTPSTTAEKMEQIRNLMKQEAHVILSMVTDLLVQISRSSSGDTGTNIELIKATKSFVDICVNITL